MAEQFWWQAEKGQVWDRLLQWTSSVESAQIDVYDRFVKLAYLYDPHDDMGRRGVRGAWPENESSVSENVVASNVDTVAAIISKNKPRARFMTDGGDWSQQRQARALEYYAEGLCKLHDVDVKNQEVFKDGAKFGTGFMKVALDGTKIRVERVLADDIVVDNAECRSGPPRTKAHRMLVDRDVLQAKFPKHAEAIERAHSTGTYSGRWWASYRRREANQVVVVEGWHLPIGEPEEDGYVAGRHAIVVDGADLFDEEWSKPFFPMAVFRWQKRTTGFYGIGLAERIAGHQRTLNKINWQIDRQLDHFAIPTTYVHLSDADLAIKAINRIGSVVPYKAAVPVTVTPQAVSPEQFRRHGDVKNSSYEESGVSRMSATAMKPAGLDSGVALREYRDSTTDRFAPQDQGYERLKLDVVILLIDCARDLGDEAPEVVRRTRFGAKTISWPEVDMDEVRVQIDAASALARTPAGRMQFVMELAQAGVISTEEARRLFQHPDLEQALSLYTAAVEDIERCIEEILDGEILVPEPYQNLKMGIWRMQATLLKVTGEGAPEEILEALRTWIVQAAYILTSQGQQVPGALAAQPEAPPAELAGPGAPPASALSPQAMHLVAR